MVGLARPYASKEGLEDTLDVAVAVFGLLGCVDDSGSQQKAPYSVRAVWRKCIEAHKNFGRFDPLKMESATHAVISGMMVDYFKFGLNPARDGKNAEAIVPMYFCPNASEHLDGLHKLCANIEKKANRDAEDIIDVTVIPGAVDTGSGSDAALSGAQKRAADAALAGALSPKAPRAGALESHWYHSAPLSMNGGWLICGHMSWNVGLAIQDVVAAKLIDAANVAVPNWAALFLRRSFGVKPFLEARLGEVEKLYPLAKVLFTGYFYDWPEEYRRLFEGVALAKYKHNARAVSAAPPQAGAPSDGKGKGGGKGGKGGGRGKDGKSGKGTRDWSAHAAAAKTAAPLLLLPGATSFAPAHAPDFQQASPDSDVWNVEVGIDGALNVSSTTPPFPSVDKLFPSLRASMAFDVDVPLPAALPSSSWLPLFTPPSPKGGVVVPPGGKSCGAFCWPSLQALQPALPAPGTFPPVLADSSFSLAAAPVAATLAALSGWPSLRSDGLMPVDRVASGGDLAPHVPVGCGVGSARPLKPAAMASHRLFSASVPLRSTSHPLSPALPLRATYGLKGGAAIPPGLAASGSTPDFTRRLPALLSNPDVGASEA